MKWFKGSCCNFIIAKATRTNNIHRCLLLLLFFLFLLQSPSFARVRPEKGPVSGGTRLTVTGRHLDAGSTVTVYIDKEECLFVKSVPPEIISFDSCDKID